MSETKRDYQVGRGKPPVHSRFKKGQSGNSSRPRPKSLPALLVPALDEKVVATIDGERREITTHEAVVTPLVNKSTGADLRATKMLIDMLKDAEKKAGMTPPEPAPFTAADEEVMANFITGCDNPGRRNFSRQARRNAPSHPFPLKQGGARVRPPARTAVPAVRWRHGPPPGSRETPRKSQNVEVRRERCYRFYRVLGWGIASRRHSASRWM